MLGSSSQGRLVARLRYSAAAKDDLDSIAEYIARSSGSRTVAEPFTDELRGKCRDLAALSTRIGRSRPELRPDLRSFPYKSYVISFRYVGTRPPYSCRESCEIA